MSRTRRKAPLTPTTDAPPRTFWGRLTSALDRDEWLALLALWAGSRLALLLLATVLAGFIPNVAAASALSRFSQWDGGWYASIAEEGYQLRAPDQQSNLAFFPLYPILGRVASLLFLGDARWGLWLVANLSFLVALIYLYRLGKLEFDAASGQRATLYLALFPFAIFFAALYSEALFVALATATFFYARQRRWPLAIALGALLPVTRILGLAILPALAWEWWQSHTPAERRSRHALLLLGLGVPFALWMLFLWWRFDDPLAFSTLVQRTWDRRTTLPWGTIAIGLELLGRLPWERYITAVAWLDMLAVGLVLGMIPLIWRRLGASYGLFTLLLLLLATMTTLDPAKGLPTASIGRYLMTAFPAFLVLGKLGERRWLHYPLICLFALLLGPVALYFFAGIWVG